MEGSLTSWLEPNSLSCLAPIDRGPDEAERYRVLDDDAPDKNWEAEVAAKEKVPTNEMTILPPPRAGHDPRPRSTAEVKSMAPITNSRVSNGSDGGTGGERARTLSLEGRQRYER